MAHQNHQNYPTSRGIENVKGKPEFKLPEKNMPKRRNKCKNGEKIA